ncbi:MAG: hypothetical protein JXB46_07575, partial [Candidatus Eisenbacteria bacterium]|nr:hypothetical protein [Candidatus Eisenbacteria bacterium]
AFYCNLSAVFLIIGQSVFALGGRLKERGLFWRWVAAVVFILILFAPIGLIGVAGWMRIDDVGQRLTLTTLAEEDELLRGATTFTPMAIPYSLFTMIYGYSLGPSTRELHLTSPVRAYAGHLWLVGPAGVAGAWALLAGLKALSKRRPVLLYVSCIVLVPLAAAAILALFNVKPFNVRYVGVVFPVLMVILGAGIGSMRRTRALLWGAVVLFCLVSARGYYFEPRYAREDVRGVARYVAQHEAQGDVVLVPVVPHLFGFYFEGEADRRVIFKGQARTAEDIAASVHEAAVGHDRLWFVDSRLWFIDKNRRLPAYLDASYRLLDRREFAGATVSLYQLENQSSGASGRAGPRAPDN